MSVIVGIQKDGVVYMGCDTQTSIGSTQKVNYLQEATFKITKMKNGVLVGICGSVTAHQALCANESFFNLDEDSLTLTKKHIVNNIVPKIKKYLNESELDEGKPEQMPVSILLAYKDKMYEISTRYHVISFNDFTTIGAGYEFAYFPLSDESKSIRERILDSLRIAAKRCPSVSGPFVLIDTLNEEYEIVEE